MIGRIAVGAAALLAVTLGTARAADDAQLTRLATCQDSWLEWSKSDPAKLDRFGAQFRAAFERRENQAFFFPKHDVSVAGLRIVQAFPQSVGMGVGFSVLVDAPYDQTRKVFAKTLGKPLTKCEASDGMHTCEIDFAEQKTFTVMAEDNDAHHTLVGCFYYYEK